MCNTAVVPFALLNHGIEQVDTHMWLRMLASLKQHLIFLHFQLAVCCIWDVNHLLQDRFFRELFSFAEGYLGAIAVEQPRQQDTSPKHGRLVCTVSINSYHPSNCIYID